MPNQHDFVPPATREKFRRKVDELGGVDAAAFKLGCSSSTVSGLISGERNPGMEIGRHIEHLFGIRMQEWVFEPKTETVRRIAQG